MQLKVDAACYYYGDPGIITAIDGDSITIQMDHSRYQDEPGLGKVEKADRSELNNGGLDIVGYAPKDYYLLTVEPGVRPPPSPWGYMVTPDGRVHVLLNQWSHGIVRALLYPEHALASGYRQPDMDSNVYHYQRYDLDYQREMDVVRIAEGMMQGLNVDKGHKPCTPEQIEGARLALTNHVSDPSRTISCSYRDLTLPKLLQWLAEDHSPEAPCELKDPYDD